MGKLFNYIIIFCCVMFLGYFAGLSQNTPLTREEKIDVAFGYKRGWNEALDAVYNAYGGNYKAEYFCHEGEVLKNGLVKVGGFTGVEYESTVKTIDNEQWDFKNMRYKNE